jgi:cell division initiation protein
MKFTPLDVKNQQFTRRWKGYDRSQVQQFLEMIASDLEEIATENNSLRDEVKGLKAELEQHVQREQTLKDTMVTAQKLADEIRETAEKKAQLLIGEAELRAEKVIDAAHRRGSKISEDVAELRRQRSGLASALRSTLQTHLAMIDAMAEENKEMDELDEKVKFLTRKSG